MLAGKNIILRPLKFEDLGKTNEWRNNLVLIKLTQGIRFPKTLEMDKDWFQVALNDKSNRNIYFGIDEIETNKFIGIIQLHNIDYISGIAEFGAFIGDIKFKGKGYGKESLNLVLRYAFNVLNLRKISLKVVSTNEIAITLYNHIGFIEEGRLKRHVFFDGEFHDIILMCLFREEYKY
jgi:RimJ/RimL family protein N-acetyltransferase